MNLFFGSFRKADADDPETFTAGCLRLFTAYPPDVVQYVVDPETGLPGKSEWLPSLKLVRDALISRAREIARAEEREKLVAEQLAARREWIAKQEKKPTFEEMQAMYGANWGLSEAPDAEQKIKRQRLEQIADAGRRLFQAECKAAGLPADSAVSPSLAAIIRGARA